MENDTAHSTTTDLIAAELARLDRQRMVEDKRARWLGYSNAGHYLERAQTELARKRRPGWWVWSHYRAIFQGDMPKRAGR